MFVTALVANRKRQKYQQEADEKETLPVARLFSTLVQDSFSVFVKVQRDYYRHKNAHYPVV